MNSLTRKPARASLNRSQPGPERALLVFARFAIASWVLAAGFAATAAEAKPPAPGIHTWTNSIPRAFLKDRHLRLYSGGEGEPVLFTTEWSKARVAAQDFSYSGAMLKRST